MGGLNFAVDAGIGGDDQRSGLLRQGGNVAAHHAVDAQSAAEDHIALDARGGADQAVDAVLRLALLVEHPLLPSPIDCPTGSRSGSRAAGWNQSRRCAPARSPLAPWGSPGKCLPRGGST